MSSREVSGLADRLAAARSAGRPIERLDASLRPASVEAGYAVQAAVRIQTDAAAAGYKIGLTNIGAQRAFGADAPMAGVLAARDVLASPATLQADAFPRFAEAEIVFVIGQAFEPAEAPFSDEEVRSRIAGAHAGIELCSTRYAWDEVSLPELIADNANAGSLVVGAQLPNWREIDLTDLPVVLRRSGHAETHGSTSAVLGDPIRAVTWLANWLSSRGERLEAGCVVASGSCTGVIELGDDEELFADFTGLGQARARIVKQGTRTS